MIQFRYNSYHKLLTALAIVVWAIVRFTGENESAKQFNNGQIKKIGGFSSAKNQGMWTWYYENGKKKMQGSFITGKRKGNWLTWDQNGNKITQGSYENDQLNGEFVRWDITGEVSEHLLYKDDKVIQHLSLSGPIELPN